MATLNKATTADQYTDPNTLIPIVPVDSVTITVETGTALANFMIVTQPDLGAKGATWQAEEHRLVSAVWNYSSTDFADRDIAGIRVRSATPGSPATVTILA